MKNAYRFIFKVDDNIYRDRFQHKRILVAFEKLEVIRPKNEPKRWFVVASIDPLNMERCNDAHTIYYPTDFPWRWFK